MCSVYVLNLLKYCADVGPEGVITKKALQIHIIIHK